MKETIDLLGKIITNILTALYEPFGFSLLLSFLAMFFYLYAYESMGAGKGWKNAIVTWYQKFKESVFFRKLLICLGKPGTENHKGILKFMEVLLSSTRSGSEKKKILEEEFGVAMSEELEREVLEVCNLSQGVRAEGREEGRQEGRIEGIGIGEIRMLVQLVREGDLPLERAAAKAKMTVEQFKETMENTPLQAV